VHVVEAKINNGKLMPVNRKPIERGIDIMISKAPDVMDSLSNWDENPVVAKRLAISTILNSQDTYRDALEQVWADFYVGHSDQYLKRLCSWGYQGFKLAKANNVIHFICWDPSILTIREIL
jgi:hypothetical protein